MLDDADPTPKKSVCQQQLYFGADDFIIYNYIKEQV